MTSPTSPKLCSYRGTFTVTVRIPEIAATSPDDVTESIKSILSAQLEDLNLNGIYIEISTGKQKLTELLT